MSTTVTVIVIGAISIVATLANAFWRNRRRREPELLVRVTTPDGVVESLACSDLFTLWGSAGRTTDGYAEVCRAGQVRVWVKPVGWEEPTSRLAALDGTAALPDGMVRNPVWQRPR